MVRSAQFVPAFFLLLTLLISVTATATADTELAWPSWRGPVQDGTAGSGSFPTSWDESTNTIWKIDLAGPGSSTPAIVGDALYLTHERSGKNMATCVNSDDGRTKWSIELGEYVKGKHKKASGCNSSPVSDGMHVYFYFKSGDLACVTLDGKTVWHINLQEKYGENTLWWDLGTSPVLTESNVVIAVQQAGPSFVIAFDKANGQLAWKQDRTFTVPQEAEQSYTTPIVTTFDEREQIIVLGADHLTAHSANDGGELWRAGNFNPEDKQYFRSIASPTLIGNTIVAPYARGKTLTGVQLGGSGDVTDTHVLWTDESGSSDVPTPANMGGDAVVCTDKGQVRCVSVKNGTEIWNTDLPKHRDGFSASPIVSDQHIYLTREDGTTFVLDRIGKLVSTNELPLGLTVATPVFHAGRIYLRGSQTLYCIGE